MTVTGYIVCPKCSNQDPTLIEVIDVSGFSDLQQQLQCHCEVCSCDFKVVRPFPEEKR